MCISENTVNTNEADSAFNIYSVYHISVGIGWPCAGRILLERAIVTLVLYIYDYWF